MNKSESSVNKRYLLMYVKLIKNKYWVTMTFFCECVLTCDCSIEQSTLTFFKIKKIGLTI